MNLLKTLLAVFLIQFSFNEIKSQELASDSLNTSVSVIASEPLLIFGASANFGFSYLNSNPEDRNDVEFDKNKSWSLGVFFENKISHKSSLGIELLYVQIGGKNIIENEAIFETIDEVTEIVGVVTTKNELSFSFVSFPFYFKYQLGRVGLKGGFQPLILLFEHDKYQIVGEINDQPYEKEAYGISYDIDKYNIGAKLGIDFELNCRTKISTDLYYGLNNFNFNQFGSKKSTTRIEQITFGVQYNIMNIKISKR